MSLRGAVERTNFHLNSPGIVPSATKVHGAMLCRIVFGVEINIPATDIPPFFIVLFFAPQLTPECLLLSLLFVLNFFGYCEQ